MTIVETICDSASACANRPGFLHDTLTLTWEERRRGHGRRRTDSGMEFAISLPGGSLLKENDCLILEPEKTIVTVRESLEPVYVIHPERPQDWASRIGSINEGRRKVQCLISMFYVESRWKSVRKTAREAEARMWTTHQQLNGLL